jgi:peptidoglycan hydrolase-like protein with peptidoglycan-binding domain
MISTVKLWKNIGLSTILVSGMSILTGTAEARVFHSRSDIISAQKRLQMKGYFRGPINGRLGRRTARALRDFQFDHNLAETGTLNSKTCRMLGASCKFRLK